MAKKEATPNVPPGIAEGVNRAPSDLGGQQAYPTLCWSLWPIWKEGKCIRMSGDLRIRLAGGYYLVTVHCPSEAQETTLVTATIERLLDQVELHLNAATTIWLPDWSATKKARQVKSE